MTFYLGHHNFLRFIHHKEMATLKLNHAVLDLYTMCSDTFDEHI